MELDALSKGMGKDGKDRQDQWKNHRERSRRRGKEQEKAKKKERRVATTKAKER